MQNENVMQMKQRQLELKGGRGKRKDTEDTQDSSNTLRRGEQSQGCHVFDMV